MSRLETDWDQPRTAPRVDVDDFSGNYGPTNSYAVGGAKGFLDNLSGREVYNWIAMPQLDENGVQVLDGSGNPIMVEYPTHPSQIVAKNILPRNPFNHVYVYPADELVSVLEDATRAPRNKGFRLHERR